MGWFAHVCPDSGHFSPFGREQVPAVRNALEDILAAFSERELRSRHGILDRARYKSVSRVFRVSRGGNAGGDVHRDPTEILGERLDLPGLDTNANLKAQHGTSSNLASSVGTSRGWFDRPVPRLSKTITRAIEARASRCRAKSGCSYGGESSGRFPRMNTRSVHPALKT